MRESCKKPLVSPATDRIEKTLSALKNAQWREL